MKPSVEVIERVLNEFTDLTLKIKKINSFLDRCSDSDIGGIDRGLLVEQVVAMIKYKDVLVRRLNYWGVL